MADLICLGELLVDFIPTVPGNKLRDVPSFEKAAGGAPGNVAAGFAKLGGKSAFIGKVGNDEFGFFLEETLKAAGVDTSELHKTSEAQTGLAFISLTAAGERSFIFYRHSSADMLLSPDEINEEQIRNSRIFHFGSNSLIADPIKKAAFKAVRAAHRNRVAVSFDPNLRPALWSSLTAARNAIHEALEWVDFLKISAEELELISGMTEPEAAQSFLFENFSNLKLVAITFGEKGCYICTKDTLTPVLSYKVDVIDATGAGDGFTVGFLYELNRLSNGQEEIDWRQPKEIWEQTARFANAVGALVVTKRGAIPAMPDLETVNQLMSK